MVFLLIFRNINFTKTRQNWVQQFLLVLHNNEKPCIVAKEFDTSAQCRLGIDGQEFGIQENNRFEHDTVVGLDIRFGEKFQFFADEFDAFSVGTIHNHDIGFQFLFVVLVDFQQEFVHDGSFAGAGRAVENQMRNPIGLIERIQFVIYFLMNGENFHS